jgi:hypothetical protein
MQLTGVDGHPEDDKLKVFADATGMQVKAPAGFAIVRGHFYENTDEVLLELSPSGNNPRRDLVVLRLDASVDSVVLAVVEGTPAVSPSDPSLVQVPGGIWEEPLARVVVSASASTIGPNDVQDLRRFLGTQFGRWRTATRPSAPIPGTAGFNTTTGIPEFWNGSTWSAFTPTEISANIITSGTLSAARIADGSITEPKLANNSVSNVKISAVDASKVSSGTLNGARIPDLPASKITSGAFALDRIPALPASRITSGSFVDARIPNLDASKITSGSFGSVRIATGAITFGKIADASINNPKYQTGSVNDRVISDVNASKVNAGVLNGARIPDLPASKITSGAFNVARIPNLDASKITSGNIARPVSTEGGGRFQAAWNNNITSERRAVWMQNNGQLGHTASSKKFKKEIKDTAMKVEDVLKLRVTDFKYKASPDHVETGMIAEEVADTGLEFLVSRNEDGSPHSVHYEMLSLAVLALAQEQQKQIEALVARVEELEATDAA